MIVLLPFSVRLTISATLMELLSLILRSYTFPILLYYIFKIISSRNTHPRMKNSVVWPLSSLFLNIYELAVWLFPLCLLVFCTYSAIGTDTQLLVYCIPNILFLWRYLFDVYVVLFQECRLYPLGRGCPLFVSSLYHFLTSLSPIICLIGTSE